VERVRLLVRWKKKKKDEIQTLRAELALSVMDWRPVSDIVIVIVIVVWINGYRKWFSVGRLAVRGRERTK
jgi:hypothetical protein